MVFSNSFPIYSNVFLILFTAENNPPFIFFKKTILTIFLSDSPSNVAVPIIDSIDPDTLNYKPSPLGVYAIKKDMTMQWVGKFVSEVVRDEVGCRDPPSKTVINSSILDVMEVKILFD